MEEQFYLSKDCNISITETNELPDFERKLFSAFLIRHKREKNKQLKKSNSLGI